MWSPSWARPASSSAWNGPSRCLSDGKPPAPPGAPALGAPRTLPHGWHTYRVADGVAAAGERGKAEREAS